MLQPPVQTLVASLQFVPYRGQIGNRVLYRHASIPLEGVLFCCLLDLNPS